MEPVVAAEHLQVIRTLMERSALYRRALAPVMICAGTIGSLAAVVGALLQMRSGSVFIIYWFCVGAVAVASALLLTRRQALKQAEPFWSPPTRRVVQAMLPALAAGFFLGALTLLSASAGTPMHVRLPEPEWVSFIGLPAVWAILYGCSMHAAGFYATRGMRLFGWLICLTGCAVFWLTCKTDQALPIMGNATMGFFFGALHLAYGTYLYFTEARRTGM